MKIKLWIQIITIFFAFTCYSQVKVKFTNISKENFKTLKVEVGSKKIVFENIASGKSTEQIKLDGTYKYCRAEIITEKDTLSFRPIDYMGEKYYKSGELNLKLTIITDSEGKRYLEFMN